MSRTFAGATASRVVIEPAKGVLVARERLSEREAFERLRRQARGQRRPVAEVAAEVMASTIAPPETAASTDRSAKATSYRLIP